MTGARIPIATYRLQFNSRFTFRDASALVDYLAALGITDCYASSYLKTVPGSPHGYDVADPTRLNPDVGTDDDYWAWIDALRARDMSHVLDLVPNHMGIAKSANPWWQDVLENGPSSRFAHFFDIEWRPIKLELENKVLIPILGDQYGAVLERQELRLTYRDGAFAIHYNDVTLPIAPDTYGSILGAALEHPSQADATADDANELRSIITASVHLPPRATQDPDLMTTRAREKEIVKRRLAALTEASPAVRQYVSAMVERFNGAAGQPRSFDRLDALLNEQSYRLAHWRVASEEINYRRFFDVNELAALRMEDPEVFEQVHGFVFDLIRRGAASGLRVDHVDGLYAPADYLCRLQRRAERPIYLVVEKILGAGEQLPREWPVHGATGYEFGAIVNNLFVDRRNERALTDLYARFTHERRGRMSFADLAYRSKKQVLHETMSGDINSLGHRLNRFSERNRHFRDFTLYSLISTLKEIIACFPVYRTYVTDDQPPSDDDRRYIVEAVRDGKRRSPSIPSVVFDFIERLLLKGAGSANDEECLERARFVGKFQQITSPVAAKGIEDTSLYIYNRLLSLNEVGSDPTQFGLEPGAVHEWLAARQRDWPHALSTLSTHDSKRGEDARARINVLSEIPGAWKGAVAKWRAVNRRLKTDVRGALAPDPNVEYLLYQTLVGALPLDSGPDDAFRTRIAAYLIKALREAKVHTSWHSPDDEYEKGVLRFAEAILDRRRGAAFLQSFVPFAQRVADLGIYNSLAQTLIKITAPGVPDFYQGTELWDLNLVDPDNRRAVDYRSRGAALSGIRDQGSGISELLANRADGRIKLFVITKALGARARMRDVFEQGEYAPLQTAGARRDCVFAFARSVEGRTAVTIVPRLVASLVPDGSTLPLGRPVWTDTLVEVPPASCYRHLFTGAAIPVETLDGRTVIRAADAFESFPVALLHTH